ncbi:sigma 54-interacting transcriptional regulator [Glaciimonas immobilis]|uniref:Propionate catabolism operon transcriptional regulator n=1 Tax=Glaciimonas immobilis TaxID=728004 RepID=A0A840RZI2_9BURK|nr:sigma 54-interacting transcriptional regulator [Glaciimonas immobilis]KAF3996050.1 sigma 54-interacting transcriptional regulator [Glaciimonas immobilis]MBB5201820.1 propionate catabolism operon transcriptional regulator [Glaciimonas immobilis]
MKNSLARITVIISHLDLHSYPSLLAREVQSIVPSFSDVADVRVMDLPFRDSLAYAKEAERSGEVEIFVCAGATGAFLQKNLATPVVLMKSTGNDLMLAMYEAINHSTKIAVLSYQKTNVELAHTGDLWKVAFKSYQYSTLDQVKEQVSNLRTSGCEVVIGSSMVTEVATAAGLIGVLLLSARSIRLAIDEALLLIRSQRAESSRRRHINAILRHLTDGVVALDATGKIQAANEVFAGFFNASASDIIDRHFNDVAPELDIHQYLKSSPIGGFLVTVKQRTLLVNAYPLSDETENDGTVIICQDTNAVQRADRRIRSGARGQDFRATHCLSEIAAAAKKTQYLVKLAAVYARTDSTILLQGESGTGKELFAQGIHNDSARAHGPFVAVNCAALPETLLESELFGYEDGAFSGSRRGGKPGLFELAHTGTIFLDEIGDMPLPLQTRLLRVLQEREVMRLGGTHTTLVDVRVIAATHQNLIKQISNGTFRRDLFYRLNVLQLTLPPLTERLEDLPHLCHIIMEKIAKRLKLGDAPHQVIPTLLPHFFKYHWPGNVRELENILERAAIYFAHKDEPLFLQQESDIVNLIFGPSVTEIGEERPAEHLRSDPALRTVRESKQAVNICAGNFSAAAKLLGISRSTLYRRMKSNSTA